MTKYLVIDLVGRICMVRERATKSLWAVFVKIRCDKKRGLREHAAVLSLPLSMVKSQKEADRALVTSATFVTPLKPKGTVIDQLGICPLAGLDMTVDGAAGGRGKVEIENAANLNAILKTKFDRGIAYDRVPSSFGVVARLRLPSSANVTAIVDDPTPKTFLPGGHTQVLASYVRCEIPFAKSHTPPVLRLRKFKSSRPDDFGFDAHRYNRLTLTMSNLCNDIGYTEYAHGGMVDDPEFKVYYQLLKRPSAVTPVPILKTPGPTPKGGPIVRKSFLSPPPVPTSRFTLGAIRIPVCYFVASLDI